MTAHKRQKTSRDEVEVPTLHGGDTKGDREPKRTKEEEKPIWNSDDEDDRRLHDDVDLLDLVENDTDLYALLKAMRTITSHYYSVCPFFVTKSHMYTYMKGEKGMGATDVDIGLERLKKRHLVTCLYMPGALDVALLETKDYIQAIRRVSSGLSNSETHHVLLRKACEWFEGVVRECCGPTFSASAAASLVHRTDSSSDRSDTHLQQHRIHVYLNLLLQHELLLRVPRRNGSHGEMQEVFGFKLPGSGQTIRSVVSGRNELLSKIKRKKNGEILMSKTSTIKLTKTVLGLEWHVKDLIGSGLVHVIETTVGPALRVLKE